MGGLHPGLTHRTLDGVGERAIRDLTLDRRSARVPGQCGCEHVMPALESGQHELPGAPGVQEAVEADERLAGASAVGWGEGGGQRRYYKPL